MSTVIASRTDVYNVADDLVIFEHLKCVQNLKGEGVKAFSPAALGFGVRFHRQPRAVEHDNRDDLVVLEHLDPVGAVSDIRRHPGARDEASALAQLAAAGVCALVQPGIAIDANLQYTWEGGIL